jgi:hypothetical protein
MKDSLTMLTPIEANESALIKMLWGTAALNDFIGFIQVNGRDGLKSYIHNTSLRSWEVNIQKIEMPGGRDHSTIIIPAKAIQKQHVDATNKVITIPIKAFEGKSLIKLMSIPNVQGEPMVEYHYILLQSAKDPNIVQPVQLWKEVRTLALKSMLLQKAEWSIQIQSEDSLLRYMEKHKTLPNPKHTLIHELLSLGTDPTALSTQQATHSIVFGDNTGSTPIM